MGEFCQLLCATTNIDIDLIYLPKLMWKVMVLTEVSVGSELLGLEVVTKTEY